MLLIFNILFFIGYLFRLVNFGWLMFILALPEYLLRSFYYMAGIYILKKNIEKNDYNQSILLQFLYILTSFFSYDASDANTYTFAHLWINPPDIITTCWVGLAVTTVIVLVVFFIKNLKQHTAFHITLRWFLKNSILGCFFIPALAISLILLLSRTPLISHLF